MNQRPSGTRPAEDVEQLVSAPRHRRLIVRAALALYGGFLVCRALLHGRAGKAAYTPVWELQDPSRFVAWLAGLALAGFFEFACYVPVGFLAALAAPHGWRRLPRNIAAAGLAGAMAVAVVAVESGWSWRPSATAGLVLPALGCLFGVWIGTTWLRGWRARLWLLPKIALLIFLVTLCLSVLVWRSIEAEPLPFQPAAVTSAEKRELVRLVRSRSPRSLREGQTHTLRLTEHDVNVLLAWGLSLGSSDRKAHVTFAPAASSFALSVGVTPDGKKRYLNVRLGGNVRVEQGKLSLQVEQCRVGNLEVPSWLIGAWCPAIVSVFSQDRRVRPFLDAIEAASIGSNWIEATYTRVNLPPGFREDLFGPAGAGEEVLASTRAQANHLLAVVERLPRGERPTFGMCFETAFALARERCVAGDPVAENRAAIFSLGILLGHPRVEEFLGPVLPDRGYGGAQRALRRVELRQRSDWTKHFCVSAALALLSDTVVTDAAGLLKEELDADRGGSGFSFADLLADRAGTTFAVCATRDEVAARAMQERIARAFDVDDFFPPAADLPEGIPDAELQSHYGGVGGEAYRRLIEEIERRLGDCPAYY